MGKFIQASPIWSRRVDTEEVQCVVSPEDGRWWFRRRQFARYIFIQGRHQPVYPFGPWECPANQPAAPWRGCYRVKRQHYALIPALMPPYPKRPRGRPRKTGKPEKGD